MTVHKLIIADWTSVQRLFILLDNCPTLTTMTDPAKTHPRDAFIAAGKTLYPRYGYRQLSVRLLAAEAGLSPGMFHHLFADKEAYIAEVLQHTYDEAFAQLSLHIRPGRSERDNLQAMLTYLAVFVRENIDWVSHIFADAAEVPGIRDFIRLHATRHIELLYNLLDNAARRGLLKPAATVQRSGFLMGAIAAPLLIGSRMQAAGILPDIIAADFAPAVMSDAAIAERIDWALTALFI